MRVVVVTSSFPRTEDDPSGHFVRSSARLMARKGEEVHVIAPGGSLLEAPRHDGELIVHRAGGSSLFGWPGAVARFKEAPWRALGAGSFALGVRARIARIGRVDRWVAHWTLPCAWPLLAGTRGPLDVVAHGADIRLLLRSPLAFRETVVASLLERGARFTFAARALADALAASLRRDLADDLSRASHVEPPALDVPDVRERSQALRAGLALARGERLVVVASRLIATKRVELAIESARELASVRLVVVGDGPEREKLAGLSSPLGSRVTFTGALPRRDALAWIGAADALVHPSAVEAAPTAVREARALEIPVVACDAGDVAEWAKTDAGIRIAEGRTAALADALRQTLALEAPPSSDRVSA